MTDFAFICTSGGCGGLVFMWFALFPFLGLVLLAVAITLILRMRQRKVAAAHPPASLPKTFAKILTVLLVMASIALSVAYLIQHKKDLSREKQYNACTEKFKNSYGSPAMQDCIQRIL